jgi:PPP family 3-phenylpropionic acid transporter
MRSDGTNRLALLGALFWGSMAPSYVFVAVYLKSVGLDYATIGLVATASVLASSLPQIVFGHVIDRYGRPGLLIPLSLLSRAFCLVMLALATDAWSVSLWYVAAGLPTALFMPVMQSTVARSSVSETMGISMGLYRLGGSAGWAVMCLMSGLVAYLSSDFRLAFGLGAFLAIVNFVLSLSFTRGPGLSQLAPSDGPTAELIEPTSKADQGELFYSSIFLGSLGIGATSSFVTILLAELGGGPLMIGVVLAMGAIAEIPAMYLGGKMTDKHGAFSVLSVGMAGLAFSYLLYAMVNALVACLFVQALRGMFYGLFTVSGMAMSSSLGGEKRGGLHAGFYNLVSTLGSSSGPYIGGLVSDQLGLRTMYYFSSAFSLLGSGLSVVTMLVEHQRSR